MTTHDDGWAPGTPCWTELLTDDVGAASGFYAAVLGWDLVVDDDDPATNRLLARVDGRTVAGVRQAPPVEPAHDRWVTFLAVDDLRAALRRVEHAHGHVLHHEATWALVRDRTGGVVGLRTGPGAELTDVPGAVTWSEVMSTDVDASRAFYRDVVGWAYQPLEDDAVSYDTVLVDGSPAAGLGHAIDAPPPPDGVHRTQWWVYVKVDDVDRVARLTTRHGGGIVREPWDSPFGRIGVLVGPAGERFCVLADLSR